MPTVRLTFMLLQVEPFTVLCQALLCSHNLATLLPGDQADSAVHFAQHACGQPRASSDTCKSFRAQTVYLFEFHVLFSKYSAP